MFQTDENGNLIYIGNSDSGSGDDDNLFSVPEELENQSDEESLLPDEQTHNDSDTKIEPYLDPETGEMVYPSPSPASSIVFPETLEVSGDLSLTTTGNVFVYPEEPEEELSLEEVLAGRSSAAATVQGLPNSSSLDYLEDIVRGYPAHYKYMAFKSDANYAQSMVLYIGSSGVKNASQNRIDFTNVDRIEVNYIRSGTTNYYQYTKAHYDNYQIPYNTDVFLYTNVVDGYAQFDSKLSFSVSGCLFLAAAVAILLLIFRGGGKS